MTVEELKELINLDDYVDVDIKLGNEFYKIDKKFFEKDDNSISLIAKKKNKKKIKKSN